MIVRWGRHGRKVAGALSRGGARGLSATGHSSSPRSGCSAARQPSSSPMSRADLMTHSGTVGVLNVSETARHRAAAREVLAAEFAPLVLVPDHALPPFDAAVGPRMTRQRAPVLETEPAASVGERRVERRAPVGEHTLQRPARASVERPEDLAPEERRGRGGQLGQQPGHPRPSPRRRRQYLAKLCRPRHPAHRAARTAPDVIESPLQAMRSGVAGAEVSVNRAVGLTDLTSARPADGACVGGNACLNLAEG